MSPIVYYVSALAFGCKQCIYMSSDNENMNEFLDSQMSGAMSGGPVSYTADCKDNASDITSTTCPADIGCMSIKIKALYATSGKFSTHSSNFAISQIIVSVCVVIYIPKLTSSSRTKYVVIPCCVSDLALQEKM